MTLTNLGNPGDPDITVTDLSVTGTGSTQFQFEPYPDPLIVPAAGSVTVDVTFTPTLVGVFPVTISAVHTGPNSPLSIAASGQGVTPSQDPIYRVNVGGPTLTDPAGILDWESDNDPAPSAYYVIGGQNYFGTINPIDITDPTIRTGTPMELFQAERWDDIVDVEELTYEFPVLNGIYELRIYVAELFPDITGAGQRVFDAQVEGVVPAAFDNIDPYALAGFEAGYVVSDQVTVIDGGLSLVFLHQIQNPAVKGIEILPVNVIPPAILGVTPPVHDFGAVQVSSNAVQAFTLSNDGTGGAPALTITDISFGDVAFTSDFVGPVVLNEGESTIVNVTFAPTVAGPYSTDMTVTHDGINNPVDVPLTGTGSQAGVLEQDVTDLDFGNVLVSTTGNGTVTVTNLGTAGDPAINITALNFTGTDASDFNHTESLPLAVAPGTSEILDLTFSPLVAGAKTALLTIVNDGISGDLAVNLTGNAVVTSPTVSAILRIEPGGDIVTSSTFNQSFYIENTSTNGEEIVSVSFNISSSLVPDVVFDPVGLAGDTAGLCLVPDGGSAATTGFIAPADPCVDPFSDPYELGYNVITTDFNDFQVGESFLFAADTDPISTRGTSPPGPGDSASVNGYELIGSVATVQFSDGSILSTELWRYNTSVTGSVNTARVNTLTAPTIEVLGIPSPPAFVSTLNHTVRVTGPVGADISLLISEGEMVEQPGGGYDVDPFELNTILNVAEYTATIGATGFVDIPVTLMDDELLGGSYGGKNYIIAVIRDADQTSPLSNRIVLEYDPAALPDILFDSNLNLSAQEGQSLIISDSVNSSTSDASTPTINLLAVDDATGLAPTWMTIPASVVAGNPVSVDVDPLGLAPGVYTATVTGSSAGYNNGIFTVTLTVNDLDVVITAPADGAIISGNTVSVSWTSSGGLIDDHIHVTLDDLSTPAVEPPVNNQPLNGTYDFTGVAPGDYAVIVEMANVNHIVYQGIVDTVNITVQASTLSLSFANDVDVTAQEGQTDLIYDLIGTGTSDGSTPQMTNVAIDDATGVAPTWLMVESPVTAGNDTLIIIDASTLAPGVYTATVTGSSAGYNDATFSVTLTVNDLDVAITAPADGATITGDIVTVTWASSGSIAGDHIHVTLDDLSTPAVEPYVDTATMNGSHTFTGVAPGDYAVIVEMTNIAHTPYQGISDTVNITVVATPAIVFTNDVTVNAQAGQALVINDTVGTGTSDASTPAINLEATDDFTETTPTWLTLPANVVAGNPINLSIDVTGLAPGNYTATVIGSATNYTDSFFTVFLTVSDVDVTISNPGEFAQILAATVSVQWTSTNALVDDQVFVTLDNLATPGVEAPVTGLPTNGTYDFTGVATGDYEVIVEIADVNGNPYIGAFDNHAITVENPGVLPGLVDNFIAPVGTISNAYATFQWGTAPNATWYYVWLNTPQGWYAEWVNAGQNCTAAVCSYSFNTPFGDGDYEWAIQTVNVNGTGPWSVIQTFTISGGTINPVTILGPGNSASVNPTFTWTEALGANWYYLWVSGPDGLVTETWYPADSLCQLGTCSVTPTLNLSPGTYSVWVQHWGPAYLYSLWSAEHQFTMTASPQAPVLLSPSGVITDTAPTFSWGTIPGGSWYYLWLSNADGTLVLEQWYDTTNCTGTTCSVTPPLALADGFYLWWVLGWGQGYAYGPWSAMGDFQVDTTVSNSVPAPSNNINTNGAGQSAIDPTPEPTVEQVVLPTTEPTVEQVVQPTTEPTVEPTQETVAEEPTPEPTLAPTEEQVVLPTTEPTVEPAQETVAEEPTPEPTVESTD